MAGIAGKCLPPHRSEDLVGEDLGGGVFGQREDLRKASANRKSGKIMANLQIAENYFSSQLDVAEECAPRDSNPEPID
jgi:hypothetical protein